MPKPVPLLYTLQMAVTTAIYSQTYERLVSLEPRTSTFVLFTFVRQYLCRKDKKIQTFKSNKYVIFI